MADVSLDEVIRQRGINLKAPAKRPMFGRGAGAVGKSFDARQKIGANDVRQRLGPGAGFQVKDAREKLVQKDARFKIRGRGAAGGGGGGVQDARQMINSRKQGPNLFAVPAQTMPKMAVMQHLQGQTFVPQMQIQSNYNLAGLNSRQFNPTAQGLGLRGSASPQLSPNKRVMDARDRLSLKRNIGGTPTQGDFEHPLKITKTIQQRPMGVGLSSGTRSNTQPLSDEHDGPHNKQVKMATANHMLKSRPGTMGSTFSMSGPITKVVQNDSYTGGNLQEPPYLVSQRLPLSSFIEFEHVIVLLILSSCPPSGQPMKCNLHIQGNVITSDQPILLRLSDTPGASSSGTKKDGLPPSLMSRTAGQRASSQPTPEVDPQTILKALFKSTSQSSSSSESPSAQATAFRIKI
ncbi:polymerase delta-interacting protein 3 [Notothenia coriiceps]|uniref:Polymerase delta-interacting protein 3 n=1 Tax=Notothenia coriiceps TaxID=8208 RepID=A0A6I9PNA6_9TELE|nr:PREDICTED: polymerase delta-interacting protein 3 [Notothenia coriiceps]